jgi:uncharacterized protein YjiK
VTHLINCGKAPFPAVSPTAMGNTHRLNGIAFVNNYAETGYMLTIRKKLHHTLRGYSLSSSLFLLLFLIVLISSCGNKGKSDLSSPPGYDLNKPAVVKLPGYLDEISGIAFYPKDKAVFAIDDEKGWLYKIFLSGNMAIQKWKYGKGSDFEDLVVVDSVFYVLQSKGNILAVRFVQADSTVVESYKSELPGKNEFEILYEDKGQNRLIMLCKDCEADNRKSLTAFAFDLTTHTFAPSPAYVIDVTKIDELMNERKVKFKPSAAGIDPRTGKLFMISSVNKIVAVADKNGKVEKVYKINPKLFKQPEGLSFTPEGHLLISNESAGIGASNIFIFKYNQGQ